MATFTYNVRTSSGQVTAGVLAAESRVDALNSLRGKGFYVLDLVEQDPEAVIDKAGFGGGLFQRVRLQELAVFTKQLAAMVGAGIPITKCLTTLARQQKNEYFGKVLNAVKNDVAAGLSLSSAMSKYPGVFNAMFISLLISAEETGTLDSTLEQLAATFEAEVALRHQISAGMRYPQIVAVAALMVVVFVMIFVIPQFSEIFRTLGAKLPPITAVVVGLAVFMKTYWYIIIPAMFLLPWVLKFINAMPGGRQFLDQIKLKLPVFGDLNKKIILSRMSRVFATMLSAGVPILKALTIVEQTTLNAIYESAFQKVRNAVKEGRNISGELEKFPALFPPMVTAMIAVGEESGTLDHMLLKINDFYTVEVDTTVKKLTSLIEPVLIGTLGVIIGFIVVALWMPLFKVIELIQQLD
ncbi:type II secretion system F family protein [bacterium]|nr:type II secretion system F family protein [bacterium]